VRVAALSLCSGGSSAEITRDQSRASGRLGLLLSVVKAAAPAETAALRERQREPAFLDD
jgi:hypothetical protein